VHAGIVLAAGASTRMGSPKALLPCPDGVPLALHQYRLLRRGGCARGVIVLGCDADRIASELQEAPVVENREWCSGRLSSLQAGLRAQPDADGYLVLPVDTVGVKQETIEAILLTAMKERPRALRPSYKDRAGRLLWISRNAFRELLELNSSPGFRVDELFAGRTVTVDVDDPAILANVNTREEWETARGQL